MKRGPLRWWGLALVLVGLGEVGAQPGIQTQPRDQEVPPGGTTTFWVRAEGALPLTYQWFFNHAGNALPGATNATLVIREADRAVTGRYRVRVSNAEVPTGFILLEVEPMP